MRQLLLLRHAKSSWDDPKLPDHLRPLNARGKRAAKAIRATLGKLGLAPDLVLVSSARRALQTLEAIEPFDETPLIEPMDALYLATGPQLLRVLNDTAETVRSVMLIGHNPGLHDLARLLIGEHAADADDDNPLIRRIVEAFPTGALAEFAVASPWSGLQPGGGRLLHFVAPRDLEP